MRDKKLEAKKIYYAIFKKVIPQFVEEKYWKIQPLIEKNYTRKMVEECMLYITSVKDLEALEVSARYTGKIPLLCDKFKTIVYIAETLPENYEIFFNTKNSFLRGYLTIFLTTLHTIAKLIKGIIILRLKKP